MTKTSLPEKLLLIVAGTIAGFVFLELTLQGYGFILERNRLALDPGLEGKIRILALGESTTDAMVAPDNKSWTQYLEEKLNASSKMKVVVINKGRAGSSTDFMLRDLPGNIEKYRPHLIITMMGLNDWMPIRFLGEESFISKLKTVRMYRILTMEREPPEPPAELKKELNTILWKTTDVNHLPPEFSEWLRTHPEHRWFGYQQAALNTYWITRKIADATKQRQDYEVTYQLAKKALELNPFDQFTFTNFLYSADNHKAEARKFLKELVWRGFVPSAANAPSLHLIQAEKDPELTALLQEKGLTPKRHDSMKNLRDNYRKITDLVLRSHARMAIMAYPTTNIQIYRLLFDDKAVLPKKHFQHSFYDEITPPTVLPQYQSLIFIENKNFPLGFDQKIYIDQMTNHPNGKGGFGHTTALGHEMIAENAWKVLKDLDLFRQIQEN